MIETLTHYYRVWPILFIAVSVIIGLLTIIAFIFWISILSSRVQKNKADKRKLELTNSIAENLIPFFYADNETLEEKSKEFERKYLKTTESKELTLGILSEQNLTFKGDAKEKTNLVYRWLKLNEFSTQKLKSHDWSVICQGLSELAIFDSTHSIGLVSPFIKHKKKTVSKVALHTLISLYPSQKLPIEILVELDREISIWEQITLFDKLYELEIQHLCQVNDFEKSKDSIFAFALKVSCIKNLAFNPSQHIIERIATLQDEEAIVLFIDWLSRFGIEDTLRYLFENRSKYSKRVQFHIIKASNFIKELEYDFVNLLNEESNIISTSAASSLLKMDFNKYQDMNNPAISAAKNPLVHV